MISVTELKNGAYFLLDGQPYQVIKYSHTKMGRGTANIKVKIKNLITSSVVEKNFISGARVEPISVSRKRMVYLYAEGENFVFMDPRTYEQVPLEKKTLGEQGLFLKEQMEVNLQFWEDKPLALELPVTLRMAIDQTEPGVKGNSATNIWKEATLENGVKIKVPLFVQKGERVKVDTRTGEYISRGKDRSE
ncbi:elongation factor P [Patescibacteria group bacterium]